MAYRYNDSIKVSENEMPWDRYDEDKIVREPEKAKPIYGKAAHCDRLNVRKQPSLSAEIFTEIPEGTRVEITNEKNPKFYGVKVNGIDGYCMKQFIDKL